MESEGNQERDDSKYNRVDLLAENSEGELLLIEVLKLTPFQQQKFSVDEVYQLYPDIQSASLK